MLHLAILVLCIQSGFSTFFNCTSGFSFFCYTKDIQQKLLDEVFEFQFPNATEATGFKIENSNVRTWQTKICEQFENLEQISLIRMNLVIVEKSVFSNCFKIKELYLFENEIEELDSKIFKSMPKLAILDLDNNHLKTFDAALITNQKNLEKLYLRSNFLFELDTKTIMQESPMLTDLYLNDNNLFCDRLPVILRELKKQNMTGVHLPVERRQKATRIDDWICLNGSQWLDAFNELRSSVKSSVCENVRRVEHTLCPTICVILENIKISNRIEEKLVTLESHSTGLQNSNSHLNFNDVTKILEKLEKSHQALENRLSRLEKISEKMEAKLEGNFSYILSNITKILNQNHDILLDFVKFIRL